MTSFEKFPHKSHSSYTGATLSSWSRQQKIAMIAGFILLGILLALSACSSESPKPALVGISAPEAPATPAAAAAATPAQPTTTPVVVAKKKVQRKRPAVMTFTDARAGVSFRYPGKYELASGSGLAPQLEGLGAVPMNFVQPGGRSVALVAMPATLYRGTDFASAFFHVNVNRSLSEQECGEFAVVDARNPDAEPMNPEKLQVGSSFMEKTSNFSADALKQAETQYYHRYENGACYEFVLGLGTAGYGADKNVTAVDHDQVFAQLEKILATVKINTVEHEQVAAQTTTATTTTAATEPTTKQ